MTLYVFILYERDRAFGSLPGWDHSFGPNKILVLGLSIPSTDILCLLALPNWSFVILMVLSGCAFVTVAPGPENWKGRILKPFSSCLSSKFQQLGTEKKPWEKYHRRRIFLGWFFLWHWFSVFYSFFKFIVHWMFGFCSCNPSHWQGPFRCVWGDIFTVFHRQGQPKWGRKKRTQGFFEFLKKK